MNYNKYYAESNSNLYNAALRGDVETIKTILVDSHNDNLLNEQGRYMMDAALHTGQNNVLAFLLGSGLSIDACQPGGYTLLYTSALLSTQEEKYFKRSLAYIKLGANVNWRGPDGETPLMAAVKSGNLDLVQAMLDAGADKSLEDKEGKSAADYALVNKTFAPDLYKKLTHMISYM